MAKKTYKERLDARKRRANRIGKCFYHTKNKGETLRLPFAKPILDLIEQGLMTKPKDTKGEKNA
jgi:hypothetical protein